MDATPDTLDNEERRNRDSQRLAELDPALCQMCFASSVRTQGLFLCCTYALHEVTPEAIDLCDVESAYAQGHGYYMQVCEGCRDRFVNMLREWRKACVADRHIKKTGHKSAKKES